MHHLCYVGVGRQSEYDIIEWNWADEVDKEPRSEVVSCDRYWLHDNVLHELVGYDTYTASQYNTIMSGMYTKQNFLPSPLPNEFLTIFHTTFH